MDIDYAKAWLDLKREVTKKKSHGARELALTMAELEVKHVVPEGQEGFSDRPRSLRPADRDTDHGTATHEPPRAAVRDA